MKTEPHHGIHPHKETKAMVPKGTRVESTPLGLSYAGTKPDIYHNEVVGITKREHFAALALQGLLSDDDTVERFRRFNLTAADFAVQAADELIEALNKGQEDE